MNKTTTQIKEHNATLVVNMPEGVASNLVEVLLWRAENQAADKAITFLVDGDEQTEIHTYASLDKRARAIAAFLQQHGKTGDRIMMQFQPSMAFAEAFFGCMYANMVPIPLYPHTRPKRDKTLDRIVNVAADCTPLMIIHDESITRVKERNLEQAPELSELPWKDISYIGDEMADDWVKPVFDPQDLAFLQYTSGSTGTPKGVMVSHSNLMENLFSIYHQYECTSESRAILWLPPYHDMGLIGGVLEPVYGYFEVVLMPPVYFLQRPFRWLKAVTRHKGTICGGPNFAFEYCVKKVRDDQMKELDLSTVQRMFNGAEPISGKAEIDFAERFKEVGFKIESFFNCYGLAEATLMLSGNRKGGYPLMEYFDSRALEENRVELVGKNDSHAKRLVSSGTVGLNIELKIVNPETHLPSGEFQIGEIWAKGRNNARGYWNRPKISEETFRAYTSDTKDGPYMRTGDLGFIYKGELFITGRIKSLIIIDGSNHYPQDIEWTVEKVHPALRTHGTAAFSIADGGTEKLVIICEIDRRAWRDAEDTGSGEMKKMIQSAVSKQHDLRIHDLIITTERIPKTTSGKIRHHLCREEYLQGKYTDFFEA